MGVNYYERLGVRPLICAQDNNTSVGGARFAFVEEAMREAEQQFVIINELLEAGGKRIAELLGVEAAYITPSCTAALQYAIAGVMAGDDPRHQHQLPDTTGLKNELVIQRYQAFWTMGCHRPTGAKLVLAGNDDGQTNEELETNGYTDESLYGCTVEQLEACIGLNTAALGVVPGHFHENEVPLDEVVRIAHEHGLPVIADAASECYPLEYQWEMAHCADLVAFGGKYIGGTNDSGFLCGKRELVENAAAHGFLSYQHEFVPFGRGTKLDRTQVVGLVAGLENWRTMDHEERLRRTERQRQVIIDAISDLPHVIPRPVDILWQDQLQKLWLEIDIEPEALGKTAGQIFEELRAGEPSVLISPPSRDDHLRVVQQMLLDGEEQIVAEKLREVLA